MLIPVRILRDRFDVNPQSVLHVGAHRAEELADYVDEWGPFSQPIHWIEGQTDLVEELRNRSDLQDHVILEGYVWNADNEILDFNLSNNSQTSSLLKFGTLSEKSPSIVVEQTVQVRTIRIDTLIPGDINFDFINLDLQGVELQALQGLGDKLLETHWIYTEVNKEDVYVGCTKVSDLDEFLGQYGFKRIITKWVRGQGWGDALYIRESHAKNFLFKRTRFALLDWARYIKNEKFLKLN